MNLAKLTKRRLGHIQSCRENNDNSHEIISGLYSDPSHFIYELLQNADDAEATEVQFTLTPECLSVKHNGKRLFGYEDVDSITTVGFSTKKDDVNSIGTFGAGFKSVFAITKTPRIYSGEFNFRIVDFIVPETVAPPEKIDGHTLIYLPFDNPNLSAEDAFKQISNRLKKLESESLLFLRYIREIQWETGSDSGHYLSEINNGKACLITELNADESQRDFLIFKKTIEIEKNKFELKIAFLLGNEDVSTVVPIHDPKLFVFFPTNERPGFKFLVHAPYKTTPSRESIPYTDSQNLIITKEISLFIVEIVQLIKTRGMLDVNFLTLLPIDSNNEHPVYRCAFQGVKQALLSHQMIPTSDNGYGKVENVAIAGDMVLVDILLKTDCSELFSREVWLDSKINYSQNRELKNYLVGELGVLVILCDDVCSSITKEFVKNKNDDWMINFYSKMHKRHSLIEILWKRPIIRLDNGTHVCPKDDTGNFQVYIPSRGNSKFKTVKRSLAEAGAPLDFLRALGLEEPDSIAEVRHYIVPKYKGDFVDNLEYNGDLERVLAIYSESNEGTQKELCDLLKRCWFVRCRNPLGTLSFQNVEDVCIYFESKSLLEWFEGCLDDENYFLDIGSNFNNKTKGFFKNLGVLEDLQLIQNEDYWSSCDRRYFERLDNFCPKLSLAGLDHSLKNMNPTRSIFLWQLLLNNQPSRLSGVFKSRNYLYEEFKLSPREDSTLLKALKEEFWLYDQEMNLIKRPLPDVLLDGISKKYDKDHEKIEKLIKALGLKLDRVKQFEDENPGLAVVPRGDLEDFNKWKTGKQLGCEKDSQEVDWVPEIDPEDADIIEIESGLAERPVGNLSGQSLHNKSSKVDENSKKNETRSFDSKAIGDWGESVANRYLQKKYPTISVVWLNKNGNVGKGYDFVIKDNETEIAYYEVKSKVDDDPKLFSISGTQWGWAKDLYNSQRGDMYKILLISNVGNKKPKVREIVDPVSLWRSGTLYAHPINIEL